MPDRGPDAGVAGQEDPVRAVGLEECDDGSVVPWIGPLGIVERDFERKRVQGPLPRCSVGVGNTGMCVAAGRTLRRLLDLLGN